MKLHMGAMWRILLNAATIRTALLHDCTCKLQCLRTLMCGVVCLYLFIPVHLTKTTQRLNDITGEVRGFTVEGYGAVSYTHLTLPTIYSV